MSNFWKNLPCPIWVLAPMEGVTDTVFRQVLLKTGKPPVMFTEFTGVEQLFSKGHLPILQNLEYTDAERPLVAQFWGVTPDLFYQAGQLALGLGFDGVDINMGCPDRSVTKMGGGSALVKEKNLARELIHALREGVNNQIPVSVKIRLGFDKNEIGEWAEFLLQSNIDALTIHGRTTKELSRVPADWDSIGQVVQIRDRLGVDTLIIGNGDINSIKQAQEKVDQYRLDGVMIGRGIFHNPWLFHSQPDNKRTKQQKLDILHHHIQLYQNTWEGNKHYDRLKRFYKIYLSGFKGSAQIRDQLMRTKNYSQAKKILNQTANEVSF